MVPKRGWAIGVVALVSLGLGVFELLRAGGPYNVLEYDDGVWFGAALRLADGALPYRDFVLDQPPGVPLLLSPVALLSHLFGTAGPLAVARYLTVAVEAVNVVLVGRLVRHRSVLFTAVACAVVAVYPAAVITSRTLMLEPYCDLWCLLGLAAAFDRGHLTSGARRTLVAGAAFGVAGACKAFAVLPFGVLAVQMALGLGPGRDTPGGGRPGGGRPGGGTPGQHKQAGSWPGPAPPSPSCAPRSWPWRRPGSSTRSCLPSWNGGQQPTRAFGDAWPSCSASLQHLPCPGCRTGPKSLSSWLSPPSSPWPWWSPGGQPGRRPAAPWNATGPWP